MTAVREAMPDAPRTAVAPERPSAAPTWPSVEYFRLMFEASGVGIALVDPGGMPLRCNTALEHILGRSEGELLRMHFAEFTHPDDVDLDLALYGELVAGLRAGYEIEKRYRHKDGHDVWARLTVSRVQGDAARVVAIVQDISEAHRAHADRERLFHALAGRLRQMTCVQAATRLLSDESVALGPLLQAVAHSILAGFEMPELVAARIHYGGTDVETPGYAETPWKLEAPFVLRDASAGSIQVVYVRQPPGATKDAFRPEERALLETLAGLIAATLDRRRADERLQLAVGAGGMSVWELELASGHISWPGRVAGPPTGTPWGGCGSLAGCMALVHPDDRERIEALARSALARTAGSSRLQAELRVLGPDGTARWILLTGQIFRDAEGRPDHVLGIASDVTERRSLEGQLRQAQKLESIGMLAGGLAHDFNNMLSVILGYAQMLEVRLGADHSAAPQLGQIIGAGQRAAKLTRQLLAFSRRQVLNPTLLDLNSVVANLEGMLRRLIRANVELVLDLPSTLGTVLVDAGQIEQVIMNLVINAVDAMPNGGRVLVSTTDVVVRELCGLSASGMEPGRWVVLSVKDSGVGMDAATRARLFEPFFTTKAPGCGTGLGLAMVHGIVRQSGGHVTVESEVGRGSAFFVHLPRVEGPPAKQAASACDPGSPRGSATILLVEDQAAVREFAQAALEAKGYRVLVATDAEHAERLALAFAEPIDLLLTDVVMPGASGTELAKRLAGRHPGLRVILMSGYSNNMIAAQGVLLPGQTLLEKPLTLDGLACAVREALRVRPDLRATPFVPPPDSAESTLHA